MPRPKKIETSKSAHTEKADDKKTKPHSPAERYTEGIGRRKTSVARVRIVVGKGDFVVNGKKPKEYFPTPRFLSYAVSPFEKLKLSDKYDVSVKVSGGGLRAQAEAVRLGLSRALTAKNPDLEARLKKLGYLTRDSRKVERKKYGLKKARRAPQWAKR